MIQLQFSTSLEWQSAIIRKLCHSPFSHVDVLLAEGLLGASDSPRAPMIETSPLGNPRGVAVRPGSYQEFGIRRLATVEIDPQVEARFVAALWTQVGKPFDSDALHAFLSDDPYSRDWREPDRWFCSELIAWALEKAGFFDFQLLVPKNRVSPADLLLLLNPKMNTRTFWDPIPGLVLGHRER